MEWTNPIRVLLVDDSKAFLKATTTLLSSFAGVQCVGCVTSAAEGLARAGELKPDLILIDMVMPGMSGIEAVKLMKQEAATPMAVIVTLFNGEDYRAAASMAGADGFIAKGDLVANLPPLLESLFPDWQASTLRNRP